MDGDDGQVGAEQFHIDIPDEQFAVARHEAVADVMFLGVGQDLGVTCLVGVQFGLDDTMQIAGFGLEEFME
ncbi:MAG: hypothetical protein WDN27_01995 [Candidatus Saccharibacteria bacterium]